MEVAAAWWGLGRVQDRKRSGEEERRVRELRRR